MLSLNVLFLPEKLKKTAGTWLCPETQSYIMFKIWRSWAILGGLVGPLRAQPILPKLNMAGAYLHTWLILLE
jgi:hypothetical protein